MGPRGLVLRDRRRRAAPLLRPARACPRSSRRSPPSRETAIVLTCTWHRRDAVALAERLGAPLHVPPPDDGDAGPIPGARVRRRRPVTRRRRGGPGMEPNDLALWVEKSARARRRRHAHRHRGERPRVPARLGEQGRDRRPRGAGRRALRVAAAAARPPRSSSRSRRTARRLDRAALGDGCSPGDQLLQSPLVPERVEVGVALRVLAALLVDRDRLASMPTASSLRPASASAQARL